MYKMRIENYTPHKITLMNEEGEAIKTIESVGYIRLNMHTERAGEIEGIPLTKTVYGDATLPPKKKGVRYVVPFLVAKYAKEQKRDDFLIPGEIVRDDNKSIVGMKSLAVI